MSNASRDLEKERLDLIEYAEQMLTEEQKEYLIQFDPLTKPEKMDVIVSVSTEGTTYANEE